MTPPAWTPEREELLRTILAGGGSAGAAAKALGITRNAAMGKAHRKGFPMKAPNHGGWDEKKAKKALEARRAKGERQAKPKAPPPPPRPRIVKLEGRLVAPPIHAEPSLHLGLLELNYNDCRWPEGHGPFFFCGAPALAFRPYCSAHSRMAYRPVEKRVR